LVQPGANEESQCAPLVPSLVHRTRFGGLPDVGQSGVLQAPGPQVRSHLHAGEQSTVSQASVPVHVTEHVEPV
jgi:hypothetical protein